MRFEDFETLVALHGTDPARWPAPSMAERDNVKVWLEVEREMDAALSPRPLSANFADRTVASLPREGASGRWPAGGLAVAAALLAAVFAWPGASDPPDAQAWQELAEASGFGELYDWVESES